MIKVNEILDAFKDIFQKKKGLLESLDVVYELSYNKKFYKLVLSLHNITIEDTNIIHSKFIFKIDLEKKNLIQNTFIYLYDINCNYHMIEFDNIIDMKEKILNIITSGNFGDDLTILSDFIVSPALFVNYYLKRYKIVEYSVFDVKYDPKFKTVPCDKITFDFTFNINNNYTIDLSIKKNENVSKNNDDEYISSYEFQFKFMNDIQTFETDTLENIHFFIGKNLAKILDDKLKNQ